MFGVSVACSFRWPTESSRIRTSHDCADVSVLDSSGSCGGADSRV